jgi:hypothetical protein
MNFRKSIFTVLFVTLSIFGKAAASDSWGIGLLGGVNLSNADVGGQSGRGITGGAYGARLEMGINPLFALSLDPMLVKHAVEFTSASDGFKGRGQFQFLEVPLFLKLRLGLAGIGVDAFAGPDLLFLTDVSGHFSADHELTTSDFRSVGIAGDAGLGLTFDVAPFIQVSTDARYSHGLTDIMDHGVGEVKTWKTRDVRLVLGVILHPGL